MKKSLFIFCFVFAGLLPTSLAQGLAPTPAKVSRYAQILMQRYDQNGDGILQQEEWEKMPGTPRAIDLNGDGQITMEELTWYLSYYGQSRTIHRTIAVNVAEPYRFNPERMQLFTPVIQRVSAPPASDPVETSEVPDDNLEEMIKENEQPVDDDVYQKMLEERLIPSARPYHVLPETLRGVPSWFIMLDKNGDGQISLLEFAPTLNQRRIMLFKQYDKNNDWFITPDEVRGR